MNIFIVANPSTTSANAASVNKLKYLSMNVDSFFPKK